MRRDSIATVAPDQLSAATGEPIERLQRLRALKLIGSEGEEWFRGEDVERVRLIQFLERRQISPEAIARAEEEEEVLSSVLEFLFPDGVGPTYSLAQAAEMVGLDIGLARRLREAASTTDEPVDEHDLEMLGKAKVALEAGFPEAALVHLARVYADTQSRVAEAEVHLFHFHVHEGLRATGLPAPEVRKRRNSVRDRLLPAVELLFRYFHRRAMIKAVREDMMLHITEDRPHPPQDGRHTQLRVAVVFLDISSYTPITDVMGDAVAAKIVERFSLLVREAIGHFDGRIVDRIGDAFLLVFPDARAAVSCALEIERRTAAEPQFPAVRGAVHWGEGLYQEGGYIGGSLNMASRVAGQASPHQILATAAVRSETGGLAGVTFAPLGMHRLKGLGEEVELFEVRSAGLPRVERARDPVCGMEMALGQVAATLVVDGQELAFCCEKCLRLFLESPQKHRG